MKRREFLKSTGAALATASTAAATAVAASPSPVPAGPADDRGKDQEQVHARGMRTTARLRITTDWADGVSGPIDIAQRLALRITDASDGRLHAVLDGVDTLDETASRSVEFAHHGSELRHAARHPAHAYFAGLPTTVGLSAADLENWVSFGGGQQLWDELAFSAGVKPLLAGHLGTDQRLYTTRPLTGFEALRGLRIAASGPMAGLARAVGAVAVDVPARDFAAAFASGAVEAVASAPVHALAIGLAARARHSYSPGLAAAGEAISLRIPLSDWAALSPSDRTTVAACAGEAYRVCVAEARVAATLAETVIAERHGLPVSPLPAAIAAALPRLAETVVAELAAHDAMSRRINDSYMAFRRALPAQPLSGPAPPIA